VAAGNIGLAAKDVEVRDVAADGLPGERGVEAMGHACPSVDPLGDWRYKLAVSGEPPGSMPGPPLRSARLGR
jgi:hypothetical protein